MTDPSKTISATWTQTVKDAATNNPTIVTAKSRTGVFLQELGQAYSRLAPRPAAEGSISSADTSTTAISASKPPANLSDSSLRGLVVAAARQEGVPPALLAAVVQAESGFQPRAISPAGAKGLTQLMDGTAHSLGVTNPFDPWQNLVGGARFLHELIARYHNNYSLALAAYNAGPGAVDAAHGQIPPFVETQTYVPRVLALYQKYLME